MAINDNAVAMPYRHGGVTIRWLPGTVTRLNRQIETQARRYNIDANLVAIVMTLESGGDPKADSGQAQGLMQVTPYTAQDIANKYVKQPVKKYDLFDSNTSIEFGTAYLAYLRDTFCGHVGEMDVEQCAELIAAGYNGGPGAANSLFKGEGLTDTQTVYYSGNVRNMWRERDAKSSPTYERWLADGGQRLVDAATRTMKKK